MAKLTRSELEGLAAEKFKGKAPIVRIYSGFIILAQSEQDFKSKVSSIDRGDTKGFYNALTVYQNLQEEEFVKCIESPFYFYQKYWVVRDKNGNIVPKKKITEEEFNAIVAKFRK